MISKDDLAYVLLIIKGTKMPEREVDVPKDDHAIGIMQAVTFEGEGNEKKFSIRKGGQAKIHKYFLSFYANRKGQEGKPKPKEDPEL